MPYRLTNQSSCYCKAVTNTAPLNFSARTDISLLVNNQLDAQFFMCIYFYSLHVSGSHVPIIRRINVSLQHLVYVTVQMIIRYAG